MSELDGTKQDGSSLLFLYFHIFDLSQIRERIDNYFVDFEYMYIEDRIWGKNCYGLQAQENAVAQSCGRDSRLLAP